jgi:hypothetical protein
MAQAIGVLVEILTGSVFKDGKATKITTEPILDWINERGSAITKQAVASQWLSFKLTCSRQDL